MQHIFKLLTVVGLECNWPSVVALSTVLINEVILLDRIIVLVSCCKQATHYHFAK